MSYYKDDSQMIIDPLIIKWNDEYRIFMSEIYLAGRKAGQEEIDRLQSKLDCAVSALEFYGNIAAPLMADNEECNHELSGVYYRGGKRARLALEEIRQSQ